MSNRTWACIDCGKTYRRDQNISESVQCAICNKNCEYVHWKIRVPSPTKKSEWIKFWNDYKREKALIAASVDGHKDEMIKLPILNMTINNKNLPNKRMHRSR